MTGGRKELKVKGRREALVVYEFMDLQAD